MRNYKQPKRKYFIDIRITTGLNITLDQKKIKNNCKYIGIELPNNESRISIRKNLSILTISCRSNNYVQYEINGNFNINELYNMNDDFIPFELKPLISQAYELTQIETPEDLIAM